MSSLQPSARWVGVSVAYLREVPQPGFGRTKPTREFDVFGSFCSVRGEAADVEFVGTAEEGPGVRLWTKHSRKSSPAK